MRAAVCREHGPPEALVIDDLPDPQPGPGEVVVRIEAAAVNFPDVLILDNRYQLRLDTPFVPGSEFAGRVTATGSDVTDPAVGDLVSGAAMCGAFAEQIALPAGAVQRVPDGVTAPDAAAFGVAYSTAYHALRSVAEVQRGETVLVLGAAGGVGMAAVDLAQTLGATVIAAASTGEKRDVCRQRGAAQAIDYNGDFRATLREAVPDGVDVVIDPVGGSYSEPALRATRWGGRFVTIGFAAGEIPAIPLNLVLLKGVTVKGFEIRTFGDHAPDLMARDRAELDQLLADGTIRPFVGATHSLDETAAALRTVADRRAIGKVLVLP